MEGSVQSQSISPRTDASFVPSVSGIGSFVEIETIHMPSRGPLTDVENSSSVDFNLVPSHAGDQSDMEMTSGSDVAPPSQQNIPAQAEGEPSSSNPPQDKPMPPQGDVPPIQDEPRIPRIEIVQEDEQPDYGEDNTWEYSQEFVMKVSHMSASSSWRKKSDSKLHPAGES